MLRRALISTFLGAAVPTAGASAAELNVAADIGPTHSLVAAVLGERGTAHLLIPGAASPHDHALRPSDGRALQDADLVVWIGEELTPWLEGPLDAMAGAAPRLKLLDAPGVVRRAGAAHDYSDHGDHGGHGDHEEHGDHEGHADRADKDDQDHGHAHDEHAHGDEAHQDDHDDAAFIDPHIWLDPQNAAAMSAAIRDRLSALDPENAAAYAANAAAMIERLNALDAAVADAFGDLKGEAFMVQHDALGYFSDHYGLASLGGLADQSAREPGPARLKAALADLEEVDLRCVLLEEGEEDAILSAVAAERGVATATIDLRGARWSPGPDLAARTIEALAEDVAGCLRGPAKTN